MKRIKCVRPISSIRIRDEIVKFEGFKVQDKTIIVSDILANELLCKDGFELVEDLGKDIVKKVDLNKYNRQFKKSTWIDKLKSFVTGGKR